VGVKFSCERCGKRYLTAEAPAPGRVYRLKCKACGHLVVLRAAADPATPREPFPAAPAGGEIGASGPDATTEVTMTSSSGEVPLPGELEPAAADGRWVELFSDGAAPPPTEDDPVPAVAEAAPPPKIAVIPRPPATQKAAFPVALFAGGVAVLVGIVAFVLLSAQKAPPAAATPPPASAAEIVPEPDAAPRAPAADSGSPAGAAAPAPVPEEPSEEERRALEERRREPEAAQARAQKARREREARERAERERAELERRERERERQERLVAASAGQPEVGLTPAQVGGVLQATKASFDGCIQAARGTKVKLDGRRVTLRLDIRTSGTVTSPTLDDVTLDGTELGACLKDAARLMVFPRFRGDTMRVDVSLVLR
jgi:hypothetical protein